MPRLVRSLLCKRVITDRDTNDVTFVDCVERLAPKKLPATLPRLILATLWKPDGSEKPPHLRVTIVGPHRRKIVAHEFPPIEIKPEHSSHRINIELHGAPVKDHGEHGIRVEVRTRDAKRWTKLADIPLEIVDPLPEGEWSAT